MPPTTRPTRYRQPHGPEYDPVYLRDVLTRAQQALDVSTDDNDRETRLTDLLTHLRHYAQHHRLQFYAALDRSYVHYLAERK